MKTCPVCQAIAFDDAETCFGCLHSFTEDGPLAELASIDKPVSPAEGEPVRAGVAAPGFLIRFTPFDDAAGDIAWSCAVEAVS